MTTPAAPFDCLVVGASRGIGRAIARRLLDRTDVRRVYATTRQPQAGEEVDASRWRGLVADVTDENSLQALADTLQADAARLQLVIHCAGLLHGPGMAPEKALFQCRGDHLMQLFAVNSIGPLMLARCVLPLLPRRDPSHFAVLSAMVGSIGDNRLGGWYGYRASKAALNQFMRTLAIECHRTHPGLCITAIHPGTTDTDLSRPFQANVEPDKLYPPELSARRILDVVLAGAAEDSGRFVNWDGRRIPW